jgi:hypothetical protein
MRGAELPKRGGIVAQLPCLGVGNAEHPRELSELDVGIRADPLGCVEHCVQRPAHGLAHFPSITPPHSPQDGAWARGAKIDRSIRDKGNRKVVGVSEPLGGLSCA